MFFENYDLIFEAEDLKEQAQNLLSNIEKMKNDCQSTIDICDQLHQGKEIFLDEFSLKAELYTLLGRIRLHVFKAYNELISPTFCNGKPPSVHPSNDEFCINDVFENGFSFTVYEGKIFFRLPLLWGRYQKSCWYGKRKIDSDYFPFFTDEIHKIMLSNIDVIPFMTSKHIHFLYIISPSRKNPTDTDNYDTKAIVDAITSYMNGGDAALLCSFSSVTMTDEDLPEGTYITVSPSLTIPDFERNKADWQQIIVQKK